VPIAGRPCSSNTGTSGQSLALRQGIDCQLRKEQSAGSVQVEPPTATQQTVLPRHCSGEVQANVDALGETASNGSTAGGCAGAGEGAGLGGASVAARPHAAARTTTAARERRIADELRTVPRS